MRSKVVISIGVMLCVVGTVFAVLGAEPGSQQDPVVTKSYVDMKIEELRSSGISINAGFEVITVPNGKKLIGDAGTEVIVRSGTAKAISVTTNGIENGLQDVTDGVDIKGNAQIVNNHLIIIPRKDGRGISITSDGVYVMVRGGYTIQ